LNDITLRETYESAHSTVLAIFASHAKRVDTMDADSARGDAIPTRESSAAVARKIAPFYAEILLQNTGEGRLSTDQLRLAYSSLVNGARVIDVALAQLCVDMLLDALQQHPSHGNDLSLEPDTTLRPLELVTISLISADRRVATSLGERHRCRKGGRAALVAGVTIGTGEGGFAPWDGQ